MGICTVSVKRRTGLAPVGKCVIADVTLSNSYADGGDTVQLSDLGLTTIDALVLSGNAAVPAAGADVTGRVLVVIHGAAATDNPKIAVYEQGAAAGPLTEDAATTNNSTVTVRAIAYGDNYHGV